MGFRAGGVAILLLCFTLFSQIVKADQGWLMRIFECEEVDDCEEKGAVMVSYPRLEYESRHVPAHFAPLIKSNTLFKVEFSRPLQNCGGTISALYVQNGHFNTIHSECHLKIHFCGREFIPTNFDCFNRIGRTISFERVQDSEDGPDLDDYCDVDDDKVISISYLWRSHQNFESKYDENSTLPIFHIDVSEFGFIDMKCNDYVPSVSNIDVKDSIINFFIMSKTRSWIEFHEALTSRSPVFPCELFNVICDFREMTPFVSKIIASTFPEKSFEIVYNAIFPSLTSLRICPPPSHNAPFESIVFQDTGSRLEDLDLCRLKSFDWMLAISSLTKTLISLRITHSTIVHQISSFFIAYKVESISLMKSEFVPGSLHQNFEPEFPKLMRFESESFTGSLKFLLNSINIISIECSQCNLLDLDWMPRATMSIEKIILPMNFLSSNIVSHWIWNAPNLAVINLIKNPLYILVSDLSPLINPKLNKLFLRDCSIWGRLSSSLWDGFPPFQTLSMDLSTNFISVNVYNQSSITSCPPKDISLNLNRNPIFQNHLDKCLDQISVDPNPDFEIFPMFPKFSHPLFSLYPQIYFSTINVTDRMVFDVYFASPLFEDFYLWTRFPSNDPKFSFNYISSHEIANISISIRNYDIKGLEKRIDTLFDLFKLTSPNYIIFEVESSGKKYRFSQEILISNSTECSKGFVFDEAPKASNPRCSCPPGSHALAENALDQCVTCRPGRYTASMGLMECLSCPFNSYSDFNGASHCLKCPENSLTLEIDAKNISYCSCSQGYYGVASEGCKSCANFVGSDCPGATLLPKAQSGFWLDMDVQDDLGRPLFFECIPAFACMGTPNADGINKCSEGYTNRLCGDCLYGRYFRRNGHCVNCGKHSRFVFALCFILALFFTYWLLLRAVPSSNKLHSLIIIITWFQTISLFSYLRIKWPPMVLSVFSALSFFNFNIELFSPECSVGFSYWTKWYLRLLSPLFFISFVCLFAFIQLVLGKKSFILRNLFCFQRLHPKMTFADFKSSLHHPDLYARTRYVYVLFSLGLTMYTSLAATSSEPFNCIPNERTSVLIMHRNPSEFCDSSAWRSNIAVAYIACVIYLVFVPGLVFFIIRKNRGKLFQKRTINIYGALFIPYRMEAYYWEVIRLIRKATVICLIDFLSRFDLVYMQVILILWVISINLILQVLIKPFALESNNKLAFIWNATAIVFVFAGSIFNSASEIKPIESSTLTVLLYAFLFVSIFWSIRALFREQKANLVIQTLEHQHSPRVSHYELRNIQKEFIKTLFPKTHAKVWKKFGYSNIKDRIKFFEDCESLNPSIIQMENKIKPGKMALPIPSDFSLGTLTTHPVLSSARTFQDEDTDTGVGYQHNTGFGISHMASSDPIRVNFNATQSHRIASELDDEE